MKTRRVLVTGAGSGVGETLAKQLALAGHELLVTDLVVLAVERVADAIVAGGGRAIAIDGGWTAA